MTGTLLSWPEVPDPRPLVGLTGLGLTVGSGAGDGTYLAVGTGGSAAVPGRVVCLTAGFEGMDLVPAPD